MVLDMTTGILSSLGGLGLFLLGMLTMTDGLRALAGRNLRRTLARFTRSPTSGAITGAVTTATIQSSSATTVATVGFVGAGLLTFPQALGIIFGANIGTTITGWLVALVGFKLDIGTAMLPVILVGVLLRLFGQRQWRHVGNSLAGFGLIFVGIAVLKDGMGMLEEWITPEMFPEDTFGGRLLLVLLGIAITIVTQSSSAGVAAAMTAIALGRINYAQAAAMVIGMDVGTTLTAALATVGGSVQVKRTGYAHVIYNLATAVLALLLLTPFMQLADVVSGGILEREPALGLVAFHTFFNTIGVIAVLPFTGLFARAMMRLVPAPARTLTVALDRRLLEEPEAAMAAVTSTVEKIAGGTFSVFKTTLVLRGEGTDETGVADITSALRQTRDYLDELTAKSRSEKVDPRQTAVFHCVDHMERLINRCRRRRPLAAEVVGERLSTAVARLGRWLEDVEMHPGAGARTTAGIEEIWRDLDEESEPYRREVLRLCAAGQIDLEEADARLNAVRWLRRNAYHAWRISRHLESMTEIG